MKDLACDTKRRRVARFYHLWRLGESCRGECNAGGLFKIVANSRAVVCGERRTVWLGCIDSRQFEGPLAHQFARERVSMFSFEVTRVVSLKTSTT